jgi:hypothetical protein
MTRSKHARLVLPVALAALLAACVQRPGLHAYQAGFKRYQIVAVELVPAGETPDRARLRRKALWKAARVTLDNGGRYFRVAQPPGVPSGTVGSFVVPPHQKGGSHLAEAIGVLVGGILVMAIEGARADAETAPNRAELRLTIELAEPDPALHDAEAVLAENAHLIEGPADGPGAAGPP